MTKSPTKISPSHSGLDTYLLSVLRGRRGVLPGLLRGTMSLLAPVYCVGLKAFLLPYRLGLRKRVKLPCVVVSIGNLSSGGTGKTPMTLALCRALTDAGQSVVILSRGYGGDFERGCAVVSDGKKVRLTAKEAGDEAFLLAKTLPDIPVVVGKDRRETGRLAVGQFHPDVIVLDDGMQYWQLHRDLDIVLLNACDPFDNGWTYPRGLLREPPSHLERAGIIVLTHARRAGEEQVEAVCRTVRRLAPGRPVFTANLATYGLRSVLDRRVYSEHWLEGRQVTALSAVGNPSAFESMIAEQGGILAARFRFRDHREVTLPELDRVLAESCAVGAEAVIVTEKDAVKLAPLKTMPPILALRVRMQVDRESEFLRAIAEMLPEQSL